MFALTTTSQSLECLLGGAITTTNPTYIVTYADGTTTTAPAVTVDGSFNGTTAVTMLAAPSASHESMIVSVHIANKDTVSQTVVVRINDGGSYREFYRATIASGYSANYERGRGWYTKDTTGADLGVGSTGPQGATGSQGATGPQGSTGAQGSQGSQGTQGAQGAAGAQGTQGTTGAQGAKGDTGSQGSQGSQGAQGTAAPTAHSGLTGLTSGDDHTQYVWLTPATSARNKIVGAKGVPAVTLKTDTNAAVVLDIVDTADVTKFSVDENGNVIVKGTIAMNSTAISSVLDPTSAQDAATKAYVDLLKAPQYVALATSADLTNERVLTAGSNITLTDAGAGSTVTVKAVPSGNANEVQYNSGGTDFAGIANVETDGTHLTLVETTTEPSASSTGIKPWVLDFGASNLLMAQCAAWRPFALMTQWPWRRTSWCGPQSTTTIAQFGSSHTSTGTISHPAQASTNIITQSYRMLNTSAASAGSNANIRDQNRGVWRGNASGLGGFLIHGIYASTTAVAQQRGFFGVTNSAGALANGNPSALLHQVGFQYDSAETTWRIGSNDGSGTATRSDLGANFPVDATSIYLMVIAAAANGSAIDYFIKNLGTGNTAQGTISSDLPGSTQFMYAQAWLNNGSTASAVELNTTGFMVQSDL